MNTVPISLLPIGSVRSARSIPLDDEWDSVEAVIELDPEMLERDATRGLEAFSHVEVVYHFHRTESRNAQRGARHPRGRSDWPCVGILAQRAKDRPNHLGVTICKLVSIDGRSLTVSGLDAIDGTPVLDVKPVMAEFLPRGMVIQPCWSKELMRDYWSLAPRA